MLVQGLESTTPCDAMVWNTRWAGVGVERMGHWAFEVGGGGNGTLGLRLSQARAKGLAEDGKGCGNGVVWGRVLLGTGSICV